MIRSVCVCDLLSCPHRSAISRDNKKSIVSTTDVREESIEWGAAWSLHFEAGFLNNGHHTTWQLLELETAEQSCRQFLNIDIG